MGRPPLDIGQHGSVSFTRESGGWVARCRFRDLDGVTRRVERRGTSRTAADAALREQLRQRGGRHAQRLRLTSRFRDAAGVWLAKIADCRTDSTIKTYSYWLDALVLPRLGEQRLGEFDTAHLDEFFSGLEREARAIDHDDGTTTGKPRYSASTLRTIRTVVRGILQRAVLDGAIPANPTRRSLPVVSGAICPRDDQPGRVLPCRRRSRMWRVCIGGALRGRLSTPATRSASNATSRHAI